MKKNLSVRKVLLKSCVVTSSCKNLLNISKISANIGCLRCKGFRSSIPMEVLQYFPMSTLVLSHKYSGTLARVLTQNTVNWSLEDRGTNEK